MLGEATLTHVVRDERASLMARVREQLDREAAALGIQVVDVRIRRADLPEQNSQAVYQRMQTERQREAAEFRAQGSQKSQETRAKADRDVTVLIAEETSRAEQVRGEGDAERNRIFAEAYGKDPGFFAFYRSMQAYEAGLRSNDTRLVLRPDSDFFKYFGDPAGRAAPAESRASESGHSKSGRARVPLLRVRLLRVRLQPRPRRRPRTSNRRPHDGFSGGAGTGLRPGRPRSRRIPGRYSAGCGGYDANARPSLALDRRCQCGIWACDAMGGALVAFSQKITRLVRMEPPTMLLRRARDRRSL